MKFIGEAQSRTDYRIVQNFGEVKLWRIDHFRVLARENVGKFTIAHISNFSESGIWLGKILASGVPFTKSAKVFPHQNFALYGIYNYKILIDMFKAISWQSVVIFNRYILLRNHANVVI